jgi:hypothetical protein
MDVELLRLHQRRTTNCSTAADGPGATPSGTLPSSTESAHPSKMSRSVRTAVSVEPRFSFVRSTIAPPAVWLFPTPPKYAHPKHVGSHPSEPETLYASIEQGEVLGAFAQEAS